MVKFKLDNFKPLNIEIQTIKPSSNGTTTSLDAAMAYPNNYYSFNMGRCMEINCSVESSTKQSSCLVYMHRYL